jgi:hypothetical protein
MFRLGVLVLLLFVSPFFVLSYVSICMLFPAPVYDVVTSCVWTFECSIGAQKWRLPAWKHLGILKNVLNIVVLHKNQHVAVASENYGGTKEISFASLIIEAAHTSLSGRVVPATRMSRM